MEKQKLKNPILNLTGSKNTSIKILNNHEEISENNNRPKNQKNLRNEITKFNLKLHREKEMNQQSKLKTLYKNNERANNLKGLEGHVLQGNASLSQSHLMNYGGRINEYSSDGLNFMIKNTGEESQRNIDSEHNTINANEKNNISTIRVPSSGKEVITSKINNSNSKGISTEKDRVDNNFSKESSYEAKEKKPRPGFNQEKYYNSRSKSREESTYVKQAKNNNENKKEEEVKEEVEFKEKMKKHPMLREIQEDMSSVMNRDLKKHFNKSLNLKLSTPTRKKKIKDDSTGGNLFKILSEKKNDL